MASVNESHIFAVVEVHPVFRTFFSDSSVVETIPSGDGELLRSEGSVDVVAFACFFVEDRQ